MRQETKLCIGMTAGMLLMAALTLAAKEYWFALGFTILTVVWAGLIYLGERYDVR